MKGDRQLSGNTWGQISLTQCISGHADITSVKSYQIQNIAMVSEDHKSQPVPLGLSYCTKAILPRSWANKNWDQNFNPHKKALPDIKTTK